jgi:hypothetical protein
MVIIITCGLPIVKWSMVPGQNIGWVLIDS